ncbi:MAG: hypothetical protein AAFR74_06100, partial [Pseudomonadota bacterium]
MIKRLMTRILDKFAGFLVRMPPIYARMLREITANPQAFHQVLNEGRVFKRIKGQRGFLNQIASDPKTVNSMLKDDAVLESFFTSRTAPATIRNWLETRNSEKAPPFFKAVVSAMLQDDEMLDLLLGDKRFIERVTVSIEALERVDPFGLEASEDGEDELAIEAVEDLDEPEFEISPELLEKRSERATKLLNAIAANAPSSYLKHFVLEHDDLLTEILTSHATAEELLRNAGAYLGDITFTAEHRRSLYAILSALVAAKPTEVAKEFFGEPVEALSRDIVVSEKFLSALVKHNRAPIYRAFDEILQTDKGALRREYLRERVEDFTTGPMRTDFADVVLSDVKQMSRKLTDTRKVRVAKDLLSTMNEAALNWVLEDILVENPEAAKEVARSPQVVDYYARDGWANLLQNVRARDSESKPQDLFRLTAYDAPDAFLDEFVTMRPEWADQAAQHPVIRSNVLSSLGEDDGAVMRDQMFETESLL